MRAIVPRCGADHLHGAVYIEAEAGDRYELITLSEEDEAVMVRLNPDGRVSPPDEAFLSCCACDWTGDRVIRWEDGSSPLLDRKHGPCNP